MATTNLVATFSYAPGSGCLISIAPADDDYNVVAEARPAADARPLDALAGLGYRLAYREHSYNLRDTMKATGYAKLHVVPV